MHFTLLALTSISAALAMGLVPAVLRGFRAHLQANWALSERRLDRLDSLLVVSWVPLMPLAGWAVDSWGARDVLFLGSLVLSVAVAWLALGKNGKGIAWSVAGL